MQRSGGDTFDLAARSPEQIKVKLKAFFAAMRGHISTNYEIHWDPEGIEDPDAVKLTHADPDLDVTSHAIWSRPAEEGLPRRVLADARGTYNNAQKIAAAMLVRKSIEEGGGAPDLRSPILSALEDEKRLSPTGGPLARELERALRAGILEDLKQGRDAAVIRRAVADLGRLDSASEKEILEIADYVPPAFREQLCRIPSAPGKPLAAVKSRVCLP